MCDDESNPLQNEQLTYMVTDPQQVYVAVFVLLAERSGDTL